MFLLRWMFLSHPFFRIVVLFLFSILLLSFSWLPADFEYWGKFIALGYVQGIAASFLASGVVLLLFTPLYFIKNNKPDRSLKTAVLLDDIDFLTQLTLPHRILSLVILLASFFFWKGYTDLESQIIFTLSLVNLLFYFKKVDSLTEKLNFLRFVENGVILLTSIGLAYALFYLSLLFIDNKKLISDPEALSNTTTSFVAIFSATVLAWYQEYLNRKMAKQKQTYASKKLTI